MSKQARSCMLAAAAALMMLTLRAKDNVVFVCAHPDDLAGCSGTALLLAERYDVHVVDFTHGERGLGEEHYLDGTCRAKRIKEEETVCALGGFKLHWLDEIDGDSFASRETVGKLAALLKELAPRAVIMHWPIDIHCDHVMSAATAWKAIKLAGIRGTTEVYFQEQTTQSRSFRPSVYVDITRVKARKDQLIACYKCQCPDQMIQRKHDDAVFRGRRVGADFAEAFAACDGTVKGPGVLAGLGECINKPLEFR